MDNKEYLIEKLKATGRKGIDTVVERLDGLGFFQAPASTVFHLNTEGGLLQHSINVYREALAIREKQIEMCPETEKLPPLDSITIAALLHDVCKAEIYKPALKSRKNEDGIWEKYMGYDVDYSAFPLGHGEKSVISLLQWGLEMTDEEMCAIRWHMGAWDMPFQSNEAKNCNNAAKTPLVALICAADGLASFVIERE